MVSFKRWFKIIHFA